MTGVQRLQRLLSFQRQLRENAAIRQQRNAVGVWENVHSLAAFKCCRGSVSESFSEELAANVSLASDHKCQNAELPRGSADWSACHGQNESNSQIQMCGACVSGDLQSRPLERQSKVIADVSEGVNLSTRNCAPLNATARIANSLHSSILDANLVRHSIRPRLIHAPGSSPVHKLSLTIRSHSYSTSKHSLLSILSGKGTRAFATEGAAEVADVLVEHLDTNGSDHPTDADLDRALGEPSSTVSVADVGKGPKVRASSGARGT